MDERSLVATCHAIRGVLSRAQKFGTATNYDPVDPGVTHSIPQANGSFKVPGETMDDRQRYMVGQVLLELVGHLGHDPAGWVGMPEEAVSGMLEDPLSSEARASRRNLLVASALAFLVALTGEVPVRIPGVDIDLGTHRTIVMVFLLLVTVYEAFVFTVYAWGDSKKNSDLTHGTLWQARFVLDTVRVVRKHRARILDRCGDRKIAAELGELLDQFEYAAPISVRQHRAERRPGVLRRWVDFLGPVVVAGVALLTLVARTFSFWWLWQLCLGALVPPAVYFTHVWWKRRRATARARSKRATTLAAVP
jgi:hypothetical protein